MQIFLKMQNSPVQQGSTFSFFGLTQERVYKIQFLKVKSCKWYFSVFCCSNHSGKKSCKSIFISGGQQNLLFFWWRQSSQRLETCQTWHINITPLSGHLTDPEKALVTKMTSKKPHKKLGLHITNNTLEYKNPMYQNGIHNHSLSIAMEQGKKCIAFYSLVSY